MIDKPDPFEQTDEERAAFKEKLEWMRRHGLNLGVRRVPRQVTRDGVHYREIVNDNDGSMAAYTKTGADGIEHTVITPTAPRIPLSSLNPTAGDD